MKTLHSSYAHIVNGVYNIMCGPRRNENNNIICEELTVVYCSDVLKGPPLKSPACVISGKHRSVARRRRIYIFSRPHFRKANNGNISVYCSVRAREKFSCIFERVRFSWRTYSLSSCSQKQREKKKKSSCVHCNRGEAGIWSDGTRIRAVHHRPGCFAEVT